MKRSFHGLIKVAAALTIAILLSVTFIAFLPPWWGRWAYMLHVHTDIPYRFQVGGPPRHFSGVWRDYGAGKSYRELSYKDGKREGIQRYYDDTGRLSRTCEFKNGKPWSGLCDIWQFKPWLAEYRDGKIWTGAMQEPDATSPTAYSMRYYFQGKLYDEVEFRRLMGFGDDGSLIGVACVTPRPR